MNLEEKSTKELLKLHNSITEVPAGPKTFATKAKLLARIRSLTKLKGVDLAEYARPHVQRVSTLGGQIDGRTSGIEAPKETKEATQRGLGIGERARMLLMDPAGYPHSLIAAMVNEQIPGAMATDKSVRWYAAKMRKEGVDVPTRAKHFPSYMDEKDSREWLATVTVVKPGAE